MRRFHVISVNTCTFGPRNSIHDKFKSSIKKKWYFVFYEVNGVFASVTPCWF